MSDAGIKRMGRDLRISPLVEVIGHVGFSDAPSAESSRQFFQNAGLLLGEYDGPVKVLMRPGISNIPIEEESSLLQPEYLGTQFHAGDLRRNLVIGPRAAWVNLSGEYKGGEQFTRAFHGLLDFLRVASAPRSANLIAVRYIDRIDVQALGLEFDQALKGAADSPSIPSISPSLEETTMFPIGVNGVGGRVLIRRDRPKGIILFDTEVKKDLDGLPLSEGSTIEVLRSTFAELKGLSVDLFFDFMLPSLRERIA